MQKEASITHSKSNFIIIESSEDAFFMPLLSKFSPIRIEGSIRDRLTSYFDKHWDFPTEQKKNVPLIIKYLSACYFKHDVYFMVNTDQSKITSYQVNDAGTEGLLKIIDTKYCVNHNYYAISPLNVKNMFWMTPQLLLMFHEKDHSKKEITLIKINRNLCLEYAKTVELPNPLKSSDFIFPDLDNLGKIFLSTRNTGYSIDLITKRFKKVCDFGGQAADTEVLNAYLVCEAQQKLGVCRSKSKYNRFFNLNCDRRLVDSCDYVLLEPKDHKIKFSISDAAEYVYKYNRQIIARPLTYVWNIRLPYDLLKRPFTQVIAYKNIEKDHKKTYYALTTLL